MIPEFRVDARQAYAKFSRSGIPEGVRNILRRRLPDLIRDFGARVEQKLDTQLKSRRRLRVRKEMVENPREIVGRVSVVWTGGPEGKMVPQVLESGAKPHVIAARDAQALRFFWPKTGRTMFFKQVMHPGFPGIFYMESTMQEMEPDIVQALRQAYLTAANQRY